jgi:hypothetical protein
VNSPRGDRFAIVVARLSGGMQHAHDCRMCRWLRDARGAGSPVMQKTPTAKRCLPRRNGMCHSVAGKGNRRGRLTKRAEAHRRRDTAVVGRRVRHDGEVDEKPVMKDYAKPRGRPQGLAAYLQSLKKS